MLGPAIAVIWGWAQLDLGGPGFTRDWLRS